MTTQPEDHSLTEAAHAQAMPLQTQHQEGEELIGAPQAPLHRAPTDLLRGDRNLAILYAIAGHLNRKVDVHEALQEVLAQVTKLLGLQTGWVWLLDEQEKPYLAAAQSLPPYLANHPKRMTGYCLCLDTFLEGDLEGAANIDVLRCSRLKKAENEKDPSSLGLRF